ncbi:MAG TPA: tRNA (guanosine(46)-N7)-methyltransferase TrmB [Gammaproteobacteria bacterium]|nr:tRNA (guanosine(46)-N7)-methyltransferase TrmB [Gammaproteobacteria bacterium]
MPVAGQHPASPPRRPIRSYVRREGRITPSQRRALETLWPLYGVETGDQPLNLEAIFGRRAPRVLEIGFGDGASLLEVARAHPETDYLGIEVHRPGIGRLLRAAHEAELDNLRLIRGDALQVLQHNIPGSSLSGVQLFFPDPWPKKRHRKRRMVQPGFIQLVRQGLAPGGWFHLATDWEEYAWQMMELLEGAPGLRNRAGPGRFLPDRGGRPPTKFELRGRRLGHGVWDLLFERVS